MGQRSSHSRFNISVSSAAMLMLGLAVAMATGCSHSVPNSSTPNSSIAESADPGDFSYLGLTLEQARIAARERNRRFRVVKIDGMDLAVTYDFVPGRINAEVVDQVVVAFTVEGCGPGARAMQVCGSE